MVYVHLRTFIPIKRERLCVTSGFHRDVNDVFALLGSYTALICSYLPTFWDRISDQNSRFKQSVTNYQPTLRNAPEERRPHTRPSEHTHRPPRYPAQCRHSALCSVQMHQFNLAPCCCVNLKHVLRLCSRCVSK